MNSGKELNKIISRENKCWSELFKKELDASKNKKFSAYSSYWWQEYYEDITRHVNSLVLKYHNPSILEAGSGSGKASILLSRDFNKTLLDISRVALEYSQYLSRKFNATKNIKYVCGNIFSMPFKEKSFDFVWNIGVIEHYEVSDINSIVKEMVRITKSGGIVAIGIPNLYSGPIIKAWILKNKIFKFIPGYRLKTEHFYNKAVLKELVHRAVLEQKRKVEWFDINYFGSPLIMESPKWLIKTLGRMIGHIFPRNKFLTIIFCKVR